MHPILDNLNYRDYPVRERVRICTSKLEYAYFAFAQIHCLTDRLLILYDKSKHLCLILAYKINKMSVNLCVRDACCSFLHLYHTFCNSPFAHIYLRANNDKKDLTAPIMKGDAKVLLIKFY